MPLQQEWFKNLVGSMPLTTLLKSFPIFNKTKEILITLCDYDVPMSRALWCAPLCIVFML